MQYETTLLSVDFVRITIFKRHIEDTYSNLPGRDIKGLASAIIISLTLD